MDAVAVQAQLLPSLRALHLACAAEKRFRQLHNAELMENLAALGAETAELTPLRRTECHMRCVAVLPLLKELQGLMDVVVATAEAWHQVSAPHRTEAWFVAWLAEANAALKQESSPEAVHAE